jgi:tRNA G18 (ribose-2'-O)-methylase SpoU
MTAAEQASAATVDSPADPRLADFADLTDVARRTSLESEHGFFVAEGEQVVLRALRAGYPLRTLLLGAQRWAALQPLLAAVTAQRPDVTVLVAAPDVLRQVTGFHVHRGVLASFDRLPVPTAESLLRTARRIAVVEGLNNTTNLGAVFRSAAGLGMDGVLLDPLCCDPLYRRAVRVSMGEVFAVPYARLGRWPADLALLKKSGLRVIALTPSGSKDLDRLALDPGDRVAVLLGAEGPGLSDEALSYAELRVRIPMSGGVDSLNVGSAAAVTFWALRCAQQRADGDTSI